MGTAVLSPEQAKQIAARKTFAIVPYDTAVAALRECLTFEDITHWQNYAEVAQAWGKVHKSDEAIRLARAVKLHAQRRMGELAKEIVAQSRKAAGVSASARGLSAAGISLKTVLMEQGATASEAHTVSALGRASKSAFNKAASSSKPPTASSFVKKISSAANPWISFAIQARWGAFVSAINIEDAEDIARIAKRHARDPKEIKRQAEQMRSWLGDFIKAL